MAKISTKIILRSACPPSRLSVCFCKNPRFTSAGFDKSYFSLFFSQIVPTNKQKGVYMVEACKTAYVLKKCPHGIICKVSSLNNPSGLQEADVYAPQSCIARQMFLSSGGNGYDARHRLNSWKDYYAALLPASIVQNAVRNTTNVLNAAKNLGYKQPYAGITPRILEITAGWSLIQPLISFFKPNYRRRLFAEDASGRM